MTRPNWDEYFMAMAYVASARSHDRDTRHGAVVVNTRRHIIGTGYNGYPPGSPDGLLPDTRPAKYARIVHAEANAILNTEGDRAGATLYVTGCPCPACMNLIVAAGIKRVVIGLIESACVDDAERMTTEVIARDCGMQLVRLDTNVGAIVSAALLAKGR